MKTELPLAPVKRILEKSGAKRVSKDATISFAKMLEDVASDLIAEAVLFAKHAGRKTVVREDVKLAKRKVVE